MINIDASPLLRGQTDKAALFTFFSKSFNATNFNFCWYYMNGYIDIDNSTDLGIYYMRSKLHLLSEAAVSCELTRYQASTQTFALRQRYTWIPKTLFLTPVRIFEISMISW